MLLSSYNRKKGCFLFPSTRTHLLLLMLCCFLHHSGWTWSKKSHLMRSYRMETFLMTVYHCPRLIFSKRTYTYGIVVFWLVSFFFFPYYGLEKKKKVFIVQGTFSSSVVPPVPSTTPPFFLAVKEILYQHVWHFQRDFYFYAKWAVKCASSSESSGALLPCTMCTLLY